MRKNILFLIITFFCCSTVLVAQYQTCATAGNLAVIGSPYSGTTVGASNNISTCSMGAAPDQIFYYDLPNGSTLTIQQTVNNYDSRHSLRYGGACPGTIEIVCTDDSDTKVESWQNCTGSLQRVWWIQSGYGSNSGTYTLSWSVVAGTCPIPPPNDNCPNAISLTVNPNQSCGTVTAGTINLATASSQANTCWGTANDDVWYSFVATNTTHYVSLLNVAGSPTDLYHSVYGGTCASIGAPIVCSDPNNSTVTGLTVGNTYYVRVYSYSSSSGATTTFNVCIGTPPPPPPNDNCPQAISAAVNSNSTCTSVTSGYTVGATQSQPGCVGTAHDDVWFSFVALSSNHDISILNATGTTDLVHQVFSGTCGSLTSLVCSDPNNSSLTGLTVGATYYVRVYTYSSTGSNTSFDLCITSPCGVSSTEPDCSLNYTMSTITHAPQSYATGTVVTFADDRFAPSYSPIGFSFCFDGIFYTDVLISSNGYLIFPGCYSAAPTETSVTPGGYSPWAIDGPAIPNTTDAPRNAILATWQDIDPGAGGTVRYITVGTSPNRIFIAKYDNIAMYSCTSSKFSGQVMLYETSNNIEIHITEKTVCSTWNGGDAILGLHNYNGTIAVTNAAYNYPNNWTMNNSAFRFTSNCGAFCTVLPIELVSFDANASGNGNEIHWQTLSEINNDYFVLETSKDARNFEAIANVDGAGNSNELLSYYFIDQNPIASVAYYRLKQVDFDGKFSYSDIVSVRRIEDGEVVISPNPVKDVLNIELKTIQAGNYNFMVVDLLGAVIEKNVHLNKGTNNIKLDVFANLPHGFYMLKIVDENNTIITSKKIVKN